MQSCAMRSFCRVNKKNTNCGILFFFSFSDASFTLFAPPEMCENQDDITNSSFCERGRGHNPEGAEQRRSGGSANNIFVYNAVLLWVLTSFCDSVGFLICLYQLISEA